MVLALPKSRSLASPFGGKSSLSLGKKEEEDNAPLNLSDLPPQRKFKPDVLLILGQRGAGKGLYMQLKSYWIKKRYRKYRKTLGVDFQLFANYKNDLADVVNPDLVEDAIQFEDTLHNGTLMIDEIATAVPNSRSISHQNVGWYDYLTQIRKRNIEVVMATQFARVIDVKTLLQVNWIINVRVIGDGKGIVQHIYDLWGNEIRGLPPRKPQIPSWWDFDLSVTTLGTDRLFGTYDTDEEIPPLRLKNRDRILRKQGYNMHFEEEEDRGAE